MPGFDNDVVYASNIDLSGGSPVTAQLVVDGQVYVATGALTNPAVKQLSVDFDFSGAADVKLVDNDNVLYVAKHGNDANDGLTIGRAKLTIQSAVTAAAAGDTIIVLPGTYTETVTHAANNITLVAWGKPSNCIITQADANVIDFSSYTGIQYIGFRISTTAATTAINTVQGTTGSCNFKMCQLRMATTANIAAVGQPAIGEITGAGTITVVFGQHEYSHSGNGGGTAQKGAFIVGNGGLIDIKYVEAFDITCSGTALVSSTGIDLASTGNFELHDSQITITDTGSTNVAGLAYLGGTGTDQEFYRNTIHITANNTAYGFYASDTLSYTRSYYNHIHITANTAYSFHIGNTSYVFSEFDYIVAADGIQLVAGGNFTCVSSEIEGDLTARGDKPNDINQIFIMNTDNTATASNAALNISVGGTTSTGDPFVSWLITGSTEFTAGIDNTDTDAFKIGPNADPSTGTSSLEIAAATGAITFSEAYTFPVADGGANLPLITDGAGTLSFAALGVGAGGTGLTTITDHALVVGSGTAALTEIGPLTNGQLLIGSTGADPVAATLTAGTGVNITNGAGTITLNAVGGALSWNAVAVNGTFAVNNGYLCTGGAALSYALPAASAVGDVVSIGLDGSTSWTITQGAGQQIRIGNQTTTAGAGGSLASSAQGDIVHLVCVTANTTWLVTSSIGNITVV